ncbi:MAG: nitrogenase iron-molybdenum cofactor biosynthesis protein NifN [Pseudomonadota bacterium]
MAEIIKRNKALSVSPLKTSSTIGAALAFLGISRAIPMLHGSQGCTAFAKVFFVRHFREPIPLQTTAMDQVSAVMGAEESVIEGLKTICEKSRPALIGLPTTGLAETQGSDVTRAVKEFRAKYPQFNDVAVVPVNTPDFTGCFESGFAAAVAAMIDVLVPEAAHANTQPGRRQRQVNVLVNSALTPGDVEELKETIEAFDLRPVIVPDIADSLDGHLTDDEFNPLTVGGLAVSEFATLGDAKATLVIGPSMCKAADLLREKTGVPDYRFDHLLGLEAVDQLLYTLSEIAARPVPARYERQRAQLQDAMVDCHFMIGFARVAMAGDPDLLLAFEALLRGMGGEMVAAVAPDRADGLKQLPLPSVKVGDLEDLEKLAVQHQAQLIIGSSHCAQSAERLGLPLLRAGFPQYDLIGGYQRCWIGYRGTRQLLFDLANIFVSHDAHHIKPYIARYSLKRDEGGIGHELSASHARH